MSGRLAGVIFAMLMRRIRRSISTFAAACGAVVILLHGATGAHAAVGRHRHSRSILDNILSVMRRLPPPRLDERPEIPPIEDESPEPPPWRPLRISTASTWHAGDDVVLRWSDIPRAEKVRFYCFGERCELGGRSRGTFENVINSDVDNGMMPNDGEFTWRVPWLDGPFATVRMAAYDATGDCVAATRKKVRLLPQDFRSLPETCIAISRRRQRLYYIDGSATRFMFIVSTGKRGYTTPTMKPDRYTRATGNQGRVFTKIRCAYSRRYDARMPYWLAVSSNGLYGIHGIAASLYRYLGRPASHGCIRLHQADARRLYEAVELHTPVYVF